MKYVAHIVFFYLGLFTLHAQEQVGTTIVQNEIGFAIGQNVQISDDGTRLVVSGYGTSTHGFSVYDLVNDVWTLQPAFAETEFPDQASTYSVAMSSDGTKIAVGAVVNEFENNSGTVTVYRYNAGTWSQVAQPLVANTEDELFGYSVGISDDGNRVIVGARLNSEQLDFGGRIGVYQLTNNTWSQLGQSIYGRAEGHKAGSAVAISADGNTIFLGSNSYSDNNREHVGLAEVYQWSMNMWDLKLTRQGNVSDHLGCSVAVSADGLRFATGANQINFKKGYVDIYRARNSNFESFDKVSGEVDEFLGGAVALSANGNRMVVGSARSNIFQAIGGSVSIFNYDEDGYELVSKIEGGINYPKFGRAVDLSSDGNMLAISSLQYQYGVPQTEQGFVRVYDLSSLNSPEPPGEPEEPELSITLYPSPTSTSIFCDNCEAVKELHLFDVSGKQLLFFNSPLPEAVDVSMLRSGIYYVYLYTDASDPEVMKIIKQ